MLNILFFFPPQFLRRSPRIYTRWNRDSSIEGSRKRAKGTFKFTYTVSTVFTMRMFMFYLFNQRQKCLKHLIFQGHLKSSCLMDRPSIPVLFQSMLISFSSKQVALIIRSWWFGKEWRDSRRECWGKLLVPKTEHWAVVSVINQGLTSGFQGLFWPTQLAPLVILLPLWVYSPWFRSSVSLVQLSPQRGKGILLSWDESRALHSSRYFNPLRRKRPFGVT